MTGLWRDALRRFSKDMWAVLCLSILSFYVVIAIFSKIGWIGSAWSMTVGPAFQHPSFESWPMVFGTDFLGRSVLYKTIQGARVALSVGLVSVLISAPIGLTLGGAAGYFGGWVDDLIVWFYTTLSSIPSIMLVMAIAFLLGKGLPAMYVALGVTSWIGLARVIRGEVIKQKEKEYVLAAQSLGASHFSRLFKHIFPNVSHFLMIHISSHFVLAIKTEVILSFLGLGVQGFPSWGTMIDDAKQELLRTPVVWWQLAAASGSMFLLLLALSIVGDTIRDVLDPKIR